MKEAFREYLQALSAIISNTLFLGGCGYLVWNFGIHALMPGKTEAIGIISALSIALGIVAIDIIVRYHVNAYYQYKLRRLQVEQSAKALVYEVRRLMEEKNNKGQSE